MSTISKGAQEAVRKSIHPDITPQLFQRMVEDVQAAYDVMLAPVVAELEAARKQQRLAWERHAEKDAAYGAALAERDAAKAEIVTLRELLGWLKGRYLKALKDGTVGWDDAEENSRITAVLGRTAHSYPHYYAHLTVIDREKLAALKGALLRATGSLGLIIKGARPKAPGHLDNYNAAKAVLAKFCEEEST